MLCLYLKIYLIFIKKIMQLYYKHQIFIILILSYLFLIITKQTIKMNSKFELKKGEAQAYLLTADHKLTKVSDGENSYSLKEGENYLVLAAVDMNGSYESEVKSAEGLQIHQ